MAKQGYMESSIVRVVETDEGEFVVKMKMVMSRLQEDNMWKSVHMSFNVNADSDEEASNKLSALMIATNNFAKPLEEFTQEDADAINAGFGPYVEAVIEYTEF